MQQCLHMDFNFGELGVSKKELAVYNGKYVLIEGVFNKRNFPFDKLKSDKNSGGLRITIGPKLNAVVDISRYQLWGIK